MEDLLPPWQEEMGMQVVLSGTCFQTTCREEQTTIARLSVLSGWTRCYNFRKRFDKVACRQLSRQTMGVMIQLCCECLISISATINHQRRSVQSWGPKAHTCRSFAAIALTTACSTCQPTHRNGRGWNWKTGPFLEHSWAEHCGTDWNFWFTRNMMIAPTRTLPCLTTSSFLWPLAPRKRKMFNHELVNPYLLFSRDEPRKMSPHTCYPYTWPPLRERSEPHGRAMTGREQLHALGYPCWGAGAAAAKVETQLQQF